MMAEANMVDLWQLAQSWWAPRLDCGSFATLALLGLLGNRQSMVFQLAVVHPKRCLHLCLFKKVSDHPIRLVPLQATLALYKEEKKCHNHDHEKSL